MNALRCAISVGGLMLLTGNVAAASVGHYDSGHLAVMAVVGGAVALGSSALGGYLGGSTSAKRGGPESAAEREAPAAALEADGAAREADGTAGLDLKKVATTASDYAAKLVREASPRGGAIDAAYTIAKGAASDTDAAAGMAEGLTDVATGQLKDAVKSGVAEGIASPGPVASSGAVTQPVASAPLGATTRFCRDCGTPARQGAHFCASCGRKLA